jgi:hypothetical protein
MMSSWGMIVQSGVTPRFLLFVQSLLLFLGFQDLLFRFPGTESTEIILVTTNLL